MIDRPVTRPKGLLYHEIDDARVDTGLSLEKLTVSQKNDPYRMDTLVKHANARWFKAQMDRFLPPPRSIHLRGFHYLIASNHAPVIRPDGTPYLNDDEVWRWLQQDACQPARWLEYVPFNRITDERNEPSTDYQLEDYTDLGEGGVDVGGAVETPVFGLPEMCVARPPTPRQPYRIILIAEKSSMRDELSEVAEAVEGQLFLPSGEASGTMIYDLARAADEDSRPAVVIYFADFDPAGSQMPISVARKLQRCARCTFRTYRSSCTRRR
jgi:hypothetical protein